MKIEIKRDDPNLYQEGSEPHKRCLNSGSCSIYLEGRRLFGLSYVDINILVETLIAGYNNQAGGAGPKVLDMRIRLFLYNKVTSSVVSIGSGKCSIGYIGPKGEIIKKMLLNMYQIINFIGLLDDFLRSDFSSAEGEL